MTMTHPAEPDGDGPQTKRSVASAMWKGAVFRCPACGKGPLYRAYLKVADHCPSCGETLHHHRTDDAPPYMTIFAIGHLVIPLILAVDILYEWPMWLNALVWFPTIVILALVLLPISKGALVGLQWAVRMHGFGDGREISPAIQNSVPTLPQSVQPSPP